MSNIVERLRKASLSELGLDIDKELLDYAATEIERLRVALTQIIAVCDDNATVGNTALALKFVREVATKANGHGLPSADDVCRKYRAAAGGAKGQAVIDIVERARGGRS